MEFETIIYIKDFDEIAKAFVSKRLLMVTRIEGVTFLSLYFFISFVSGNFIDFSSIVLFIVSFALLIFSFRYASVVKRTICKNLVQLSAGQEMITVKFTLIGQYLAMHNINLNKSTEFPVSSVVICRETRNYLIYILSDKRFFLVNKSMKELFMFKQLFQLKKIYDFSNK